MVFYFYQSICWQISNKKVLNGWFGPPCRSYALAVALNVFKCDCVKVKGRWLWTGIQVIHATINLVDMVPECCGVLKQQPEILVELVTNIICWANHWHWRRSVIKCNKTNNPVCDHVDRSCLRMCSMLAARPAVHPVPLRASCYHDSNVCLTLISLLPTQHKLVFYLMRISLWSTDDEYYR